MQRSVETIDDVNTALASLLVRMRPPVPVVSGVIYRTERPRYDGAVHDQLEEAKRKPSAGEVSKRLYSGDTWRVE